MPERSGIDAMLRLLVRRGGFEGLGLHVERLAESLDALGDGDRFAELKEPGLLRAVRDDDEVLERLFGGHRTSLGGAAGATSGTISMMTRPRLSAL